jgi:integrase
VASIKQDPESGNYRIYFRYGGKQHQKSLKTKDETEASELQGRVERMLRDLETGWTILPDGADWWTFVLTGGQRAQKTVAPTVLTLDQLFTRYEQEMPPGSMETNSLATYRLHKKHLFRHLSAKTGAQSVTLTEMQKYVNQRAKETYRDRPIGPRTIKKEVATFRAVWNWGKLHNIVTGDAPVKGLKFDKEDQAPPFMTRDEIELRIAQGKLDETAVAKLWKLLFLRVDEIAECLEHVRRQKDVPAFVYPMFAFIAHTGARRSEMMRSRVEDFDFGRLKVTIREKKKSRSYKETRREVDMSPLLTKVMRDWLRRHAESPYTFCHGEVVGRSKKRSKTTGHKSGKDRPTTASGRGATVREREDWPAPGPLSKDESNHHFKKALEGSKWAVVRGFHVFRHSFASNLHHVRATDGYIDQSMGHQTEEMRRRYRHVLPEEGQETIKRLFPAQARGPRPGA